MRAIADEFGERVLIGEIYLPIERLMDYYGRERAGVHLPFNFQLIDAPWNARDLATLIAGYEAALPQGRSEEHTSELQSLMRISYAVFCLQKKHPHLYNRNN